MGGTDTNWIWRNYWQPYSYLNMFCSLLPTIYTLVRCLKLCSFILNLSSVFGTGKRVWKTNSEKWFFIKTFLDDLENVLCLVCALFECLGHVSLSFTNRKNWQKLIWSLHSKVIIDRIIFWRLSFPFLFESIWLLLSWNLPPYIFSGHDKHLVKLLLWDETISVHIGWLETFPHEPVNVFSTNLAGWYKTFFI